jgi:hypothetical protein
MSEYSWTARLVEVQLAKAADVLRRLPEPRVNGYFNTWPEIVRDSYERSGFTEGSCSVAAPSSRAISEMEETMFWLRWLDRDS